MTSNIWRALLFGRNEPLQPVSQSVSQSVIRRYLFNYCFAPAQVVNICWQAENNRSTKETTADQHPWRQNKPGCSAYTLLLVVAVAAVAAVAVAVAVAAVAVAAVAVAVMTTGQISTASLNNR